MIYKYFSAGNTPKGFVNYFDSSIDVDRASQILYIKGGSGVGKSTLMRALSHKAQSLGVDVREVYCSSDRNSLDAVVVDSMGIALFDATMPHIADPLYPHLNGNIVDLGICLDEEMLSQHREGIIHLIRSKKACYKGVYSLLSSIEGINRAIMDSLDIDMIRMKTIASDIAHNMESGHLRHGFLSLIDHDGLVDRTDGIMDGRRVYVISCELAEPRLHLVSMISDMLDPLPYERYHAVLDPNSVETIASSREIVTSSSNTPCDVRYDISDAYSIKNRHTYDMLCEYRSGIISLASEEIGVAQALHSELENIYKSCMDYDELDKMQHEIIEHLMR